MAFWMGKRRRFSRPLAFLASNGHLPVAVIAQGFDCITTNASALSALGDLPDMEF
jgi:hypothetical protein